MKFENIEELNEAFSRNKLTELPKTIDIDTVEYYLMRSTEYPLHQSLSDPKKKPMVVYKVRQNNDNLERFAERHTTSEDKTTFQDHILLIWAPVRLLRGPGP